MPAPSVNLTLTWTPHALTLPRTPRAACAPAALATAKPRRGDGPAPAMAAANPRSAVRVGTAAAHLALANLALPRLVASLVRIAAATAPLPAL
eukprot:13720580-Alexandrium_andersonii.AAC.1